MSTGLQQASFDGLEDALGVDCNSQCQPGPDEADLAVLTKAFGSRTHI